MSQLYTIPDETLTEIADAIRLKRDIADEIAPEDMPLEISLIDGGGSGQWWQYPGTAELIGEVTKTVNLATDTSWNNITPSTASQTILAAQATAADRYTYPFNLNVNDYVVIAEVYSDIKYKTGSDPVKPYCTGVSTVNITSFGLYDGGYPNNAMSISKTRMGTISSSGVFGVNNNVYGISPPLTNPALANAYATPGHITLGRGAVTVRGNATYATVDSLKDVDAAATNIYYRWRIYRLDKSTPTAFTNRADNILINHSFLEA